MRGAITPEDETMLGALVKAPEDLMVVAAGSQAGAVSEYIPGWGGERASESVTKEIRRP